MKTVAFIMSDSMGLSYNNSCDSSLYEILKACANLESYENLSTAPAVVEDICSSSIVYDYTMISNNIFSTNNNISSNIFQSDELLCENHHSILEQDGRISLAYENLQNIPRHIAEKFASQTKYLDLSYNDFESISFLTFFERLHTLILDRNSLLDVKSLPMLPNLKILWINNCNIMNITAWIERIQIQCPVLEHLSLMGNPGIKSQFKYDSLPDVNIFPVRQPVQNLIFSDYREYIWTTLPHLKYLDGIARSKYVAQNKLQPNEADNIVPYTFPINESATPVVANGKSLPNYKCQRNLEKKSTTHTFWDIFRLKRKKKS